MGILLRWLGALVLLTATYNPTPWNYVNWSMANGNTQLPLTLFLGLLLLVGYLVYVMATLRSIGGLGVLLIAAVFGAGLWVLYSWGFLNLQNHVLNTWLALLALSLILGLGLSWGILRQRLSGQTTVAETED